MMTVKSLNLDEMLKIQSQCKFKKRSLFADKDYNKTQNELFAKSHKTILKFTKASK